MTGEDLVDVAGAVGRLLGRVVRTPLVAWGDRPIWLKCENLQVTGSFKLRGALNRILALDGGERRRGVVAASAGNHGIGVAAAGRAAGVQVTVVVPAGVVSRKRRALEHLGAQLILAEGGYSVAEAQGKALAAERGAVWVSPYNDPDVIAGQATVGLELASQLEELALARPVTVLVPASGGGLLAGVGLGLRRAGVAVRLVGVQTEAAPYLHRAFHGGDPTSVVETPTLADGLAGAVEADSITFDLVRRLADDMVLVDEAEIADTLRQLWRTTGMLVEPSAAVALAGARRETRGTSVVVLSGGNADNDLLERLAVI